MGFNNEGNSFFKELLCIIGVMVDVLEKVKKIYPFIGFLITTVCQLILMKYGLMNQLYFIFCTILFIIMPIIVKRKFIIKRQIIYIILITLYQGLSLYIKNINFKYEYGNLLLDNILNLDQLLMLAITYSIIVKKGDNGKWEQEVISSSLKKINLKKLLKKLQENYSNFKKQDKKYKAEFIIYFILSLIWNVLNVLLVLYVAMLNETFVECIFILSTFFISKHVFGKAFHLDSMTKCFIISNLTYYCLNRITTPIGISIFVPIILGVGLAYFTSKLVKKSYQPLYKGMSEDLFNESVLKVVDQDSEKYKICYDFFIKKHNALKLSRKYNYTEAGIRKIISRVNGKIKELNK